MRFLNLLLYASLNGKYILGVEFKKDDELFATAHYSKSENEDGTVIYGIKNNLTVTVVSDNYPKLKSSTKLHYPKLSNHLSLETIAFDGAGRILDAESCSDIPWKVFTIFSENKKKPCSFLNTLPINTRRNHCRPRFSNAATICPDTCLGKCPCTDRKFGQFMDKKERSRTCQWIGWIKKFKSRKKYCNSTKQAKKACPLTCVGWCLTGSFSKANKSPTTKPSEASTFQSSIPSTSPNKEIKTSQPTHNLTISSMPSEMSPPISSTTSSPTVTTAVPTKSPVEVSTAITAILTSAIPGLGDALADSSSPQYTAFEWLLNDPANTNFDFANADMDAPETQLDIKQRFGAATAFYSMQTPGETWTNSQGWMSGDDVCTWQGIQCDAQTQGARRLNDLSSKTITQIKLNANNLYGTIPSELLLFESLTSLVLYANWLSGEIPSKLYDLTDLTELDLDDNVLTGEISPEISKLSNLDFLALSRNNMGGNIPIEVTGLEKLEYLWLGKNSFEGGIPTEIGELVNLKELYVGNLNLQGKVPGEIGNLINLIELAINDNDLTGEIPPSIGNLKLLTEFTMDDNFLSGELPTEIGSLDNLKVLKLHRNQFVGPIPTEIGFLKYLTEFSAYANEFTTLPDEIGDLQMMEIFDVSENKITGPLTEQIGKVGWYRDEGEEFYRDSLKMFIIYDNDLSGTIPTRIGHLTELVIFDLANNKEMFGSIPTEIGNLEKIEILNLSRGGFNVTLPTQVGNLVNLKTLNLSYNWLTGAIPEELQNLKSLVSLDLSFNIMSGLIPGFLGTFDNLEDLKLDNNRYEDYLGFSGPIPDSLGFLAGLVNLHLHVNSLTGPVPQNLGNIDTLQSLIFSDNPAMSGPVPNSVCLLDLPILEAGCDIQCSCCTDECAGT